MKFIPVGIVGRRGRPVRRGEWCRWPGPQTDRAVWIAVRKAQYLRERTISEELAGRLAREDWDNGPGNPYG